ncbi:MAG: lipopolysaccharide biosynthesis protein [Candidatus Limnocylindria bacterium]
MNERGVEPPGRPGPPPVGRQPSFLRRMLGESAIYGLGGLANQALAIILVPVYARQLGVEGYGAVAIINTTLSLTTMVVALALPQAFFRSYLKEAETGRERAAVLGTSLGLRLMVSVLGLLLFSAISLQLSVVLLGSTADWPLIALIGPIVFLDSLNLVPMALLRAERRPIPYAMLAFVRAVLGSALIILFVVILDRGVLGVLFGSLGSALVTTSLGFMLLARERRLVVRFDRTRVRHMLLFSLPLVPAAVAGWTLNLSDRYIIQAFEGQTAVGLYSAGYVVGLTINALAIAPFTLAWGATYWEIAKQPDARTTIARVLTGFVALASFAALAVSALATDLIRILLTPDFEPGRFVTPFSAFGYVLYGAYTVVGTGLSLESQTRRVPFITGAAAVSSVALNLLLVPALGYMGAAVSTLASYGLLAVASGIVSQRYYPVPWELGRVATLLGIAMALAAAALLGPDHVAWRLLCLALYPALVLGLGIIPMRYLGALGALRRGGR